MLATLIFAEVADKMNSWPAVVAWVVLISAASIITIKRRSWLAVIPCLLAILWAWGGYVYPKNYTGTKPGIEALFISR